MLHDLKKFKKNTTSALKNRLKTSKIDRNVVNFRHSSKIIQHLYKMAEGKDPMTDHGGWFSAGNHHRSRQ